MVYKIRKIPMNKEILDNMCTEDPLRLLVLPRSWLPFSETNLSETQNTEYICRTLNEI